MSIRPPHIHQATANELQSSIAADIDTLQSLGLIDPHLNAVANTDVDASTWAYRLQSAERARAALGQLDALLAREQKPLLQGWFIRDSEAIVRAINALLANN